MDIYQVEAQHTWYVVADNQFQALHLLLQDEEHDFGTTELELVISGDYYVTLGTSVPKGMKEDYEGNLNKARVLGHAV